MYDAFETADTILSDISEGKPMLQAIRSHGANSINALLGSRGIRPISYCDWKKIDKAEINAGALKGKPREKIGTVEEMIDLL